MKYTSVLAFAVVGSAFVLPAQETIAEIEVNRQPQNDRWYDDAVATTAELWSGFSKSVKEVGQKIKDAGEEAFGDTSNAFDVAMNGINEASKDVATKAYDTAFDTEAWLESELRDFDMESEEPEERPPHHKRPHHKRPHHGRGKSNATIYELINKSKYTTQLAFLINQYPDLVETLNSTKANYTLFAPTDKAFEKIPKHAPKPSKEEIKAILSYHTVPDFYPAGRVLVSHTVPTLLKSDSLGKEPLPQRLSFHINLRGLTVNFYSRIIAINIPATNGVIHGVDSLIIPPPKVLKIIDLLPGEFSTLELGLAKTGLLEKLNTTKHAGGTFFAPSNRAFSKLGPRINAFLFSKHGLKYLKALLEYHLVPDNTLYSDALYSADDAKSATIPKGRFHVDLPTLLKDRSLSVDIARFGGFISIKINGFSRVAVQDGIAADGVIHVLPDVLIPPKKLGGAGENLEWTGEELEVEDLVDRLEPFVNDEEL